MCALCKSVYLTGRRDYMFKRHGQMVSAAEIEAALISLGLGIQKCSVGLFSELIIAFVLLVDGDRDLIVMPSSNEDEFAAFETLVLRSIPALLKPDFVFSVAGVFPLSLNGKVDLKALYSRFLLANNSSPKMYFFS